MGSPLRVLHVVVNMNRGGAETLLMNLYRNMDRTRVQFDFLTCREGEFDATIKQMGGRIHRIPYITDVGHHGFRRGLRQFFQQNQEYSIVHSHLDKMSGLVLREAKAANVPIRISHSHNTESEGSLATKLYKSFAGSFITQSATHYYACSQAAANWLFKNKAQQAFILKNGIEADKFQFSQQLRNDMREKLRISENTFVIGHVGRFTRQKNHLYLLELFKEIQREIPNTVLLLVGDGPLKSKVKKRISELNLESHVRLLGIRKDIHLLLQAFDTFIFPSLHEGLPVTLIEAQTAGLPCIIANTITKEVDMGFGLIEYIELNAKDRWIKQIMKCHKAAFTRYMYEDAVSQRGYDIRKTARETQDAYINLREEIV
ncbi:glycosyltransferase family 1 protein [Virgibacillus salarius]|uniref:glycosyltransferase family 1 protein n=1 Tax=Virgibacillus salarius TaxID=447199 RepID=UPI0031D2766A